MEKEAWEFVQLSSKKAVRRSRAEPEPELWEGGESGRYQGTTGGSSVSPALAPHVMLIPLKTGGNRLSGETVTVFLMHSQS